MKLYTRAALGVIAAFVLTYVVLGLVKAYFIDPERRRAMVEVVESALKVAAQELDAPDDQRRIALETLNVSWGGKLSVEQRTWESNSGWTMVGDRMFAYVRISGSDYLLYGPLPDIDPHSLAIGMIALGIPVLLAAIIAFIIVAPVVTRARALGKITERLAEGDLTARAPVAAGRDALSQLAVRFNEMAAEIERLVRSKQELLQAVSHEFRTPSSRIRFELEMLCESKDDVERRRRGKSIDDSLIELDELVDEILTYARFDGREPKMALDSVCPTDVAAEIEAEITDMRPEVSFAIRHEPDLVVTANPRYFRRALRNIMLNAERHAESLVEVAVSRGDGEVRIQVQDDGPGVPDEHRDRVFEPFARLEGSRAPQRGGAGLGLAIVKRICEWHGAAVRVEDSDVGARFVMCWPAPRQET